MAPELFGMRPKYSKQSDVYAYGVILWEITTRKIPYEEVEEGELREGIKRGEREVIPSNSILGDIIRGCWKQEAEQRMDLENVMYLLNEIKQAKSVENKLISGTKIVRQEEEKLETMQKKIEKLQVQEAGYQGEMRNGKMHGYGVYNELMEIDMQDNGQKIQNKEKELFIQQMETYMRESDQKIKIMDMECLNELMELDMKDNLQKIYNKEKELIIMPMETYMRESIQKVKSMAMEFINVLMEIDMKDNLQKIKDKEKELIIMQMEAYMRESGQKVKSMDMECLNEQMEIDTKDNLQKIQYQLIQLYGKKIQVYSIFLFFKIKKVQFNNTFIIFYLLLKIYAFKLLGKQMFFFFSSLKECFFQESTFYKIKSKQKKQNLIFFLFINGLQFSFLK